MAIEYPNTDLYINGNWRPAVAGDTLDVINPATEEVIGQVARARRADLDEALEAADRAFKSWKKTTPLDRYKIPVSYTHLTLPTNREV